MREKFFKSGEHWVWFNAGAVAISLVMVFGLLILIAVRGLGHFWPASVHQFELQNEEGVQLKYLGEIYDEQLPKGAKTDHEKQLLIKKGNREVYGLDFSWIPVKQMTQKSSVIPKDVVVLERREWGNFYGFLKHITLDGVVQKGDVETSYTQLVNYIDDINLIYDEIKELQETDIGKINYQLEQLRLDRRRLELKNKVTPDSLAKLDKQKQRLDEEFAELREALNQLYAKTEKKSVIVETIEGKELTIPIANIVRSYRPNQMSVWSKIGFYFEKIGEFLLDEPREANTEGGVFPAIFGTVMMVLLMSVIVTPFGVIAAVYLHEYAKQGFLTRLIRIAVNNLAGVPSIVYGVFGLGFFVYFMGGSIDELFYPEAQPAPTFGTPGLLWASITLALLTLPVVIVSTEEGLSRIPRSLREGSLALGATKIETLWKTILPMSSPAMMTGLILAIARAAGEVAPLMLVGVVKLAPTLPLDGNAPFLHLERKFMHLGFHIYDVGFQSPNVEAARPLVYATALLLILVIVLLNITAIKIRNNLREKYKSLEH